MEHVMDAVLVIDVVSGAIVERQRMTDQASGGGLPQDQSIRPMTTNQPEE